MKVHSTHGNGFQEIIYQRALAIEMRKQDLNFQREMEMTIYRVYNVNHRDNKDYIKNNPKILKS